MDIMLGFFLSLSPAHVHTHLSSLCKSAQCESKCLDTNTMCVELQISNFTTLKFHQTKAENSIFKQNNAFDILPQLHKEKHPFHNILVV